MNKLLFLKPILLIAYYVLIFLLTENASIFIMKKITLEVSHTGGPFSSVSLYISEFVPCYYLYFIKFTYCIMYETKIKIVITLYLEKINRLKNE